MNGMGDPLPVPTDRELVAAVRAGDEAALDALVARYETRVFRFGLTMCHDVEDARDALQDTLLAMVRSLNTYRGESSLSTWLYAIAHHACLRKRRRRQGAPTHLASLEALEPHDRDRMAAPAPNPEDAAAAGEMRTALHAAIRGLPPAQRAVLLLRDVEGLTAPDAAEALGLSVAAVKSRLHRARLAVREALAPGDLAAQATPFGTRGCPDVLTSLSKHLEGDLSAELCASLEAHLSTCGSCRTACESLKAALGACRASPLPVVPAATRRRVREAVRACLAAEVPGAPSTAKSIGPLRDPGDA
jgi:RNA polymerase sigma-70 factor, ECF subfamily